MRWIARKVCCSLSKTELCPLFPRRRYARSLAFHIHLLCAAADGLAYEALFAALIEGATCSVQMRLCAAFAPSGSRISVHLVYAPSCPASYVPVGERTFLT